MCRVDPEISTTHMLQKEAFQLGSNRYAMKWMDIRTDKKMAKCKHKRIYQNCQNAMLSQCFLEMGYKKKKN